MTGGTIGLRRPQFLNPVELIREGVGKAVDAGSAFWAIWAIYGVAVAGIQIGAKAAGLSILANPTSPQTIAYQLLLVLAASLAQTLGLRLVLGQREAWLRLDRAALAAGGLLFLAQATISATAAIMASSMTGGRFSFASYLVGLVAYLGGVYVAGKLALWPLEILAGRRDAGPGRAWRLMRGTLRSLVLASVLLAIPLGAVSLLGTVVVRIGPQNQPWPFVLVTTAAAVVAAAIGQGVIVAIYEKRGGLPETVGEIFD